MTEPMHLQRLFIGIKFSSEIIDALAATSAAMQAQAADLGADISWVSRDNFHLTLKFIGTKATADAAIAALNPVALASPVFEVQVKSCLVFPNESRPAMLWARVFDENEALSSLARAVESALAGVGVPAEPYPFTPHVTLGRVKSGRVAGELLFPYKMRDFGSMRVSSFDLFLSEQIDGCPKYTSLYSFQMTGTA